MSDQQPSKIEDVIFSMRTNYMGIASFTILIWDHLVSLSDEIEYVWKGTKGPIVYLFFFIRYFTPLAFSVNLYAYFSPTWTLESCAHFVRYEGVATVICIETVGLMMLLRIQALYSGHKWLVRSLAIFLLLETGVNAWLITHGEPVVHNLSSGIHSCTMIFNPSISDAASSSAWIPLLYDSIVLGLTLYRTIPPIKNRQAGYITQRLLEDGVLYYSVIFSVTLVLTIEIISSPPGLKNITAQLEQLLTVAMMSRITIGLKKAGRAVRRDTVPLGSPLILRTNLRHTAVSKYSLRFASPQIES